MQKMQMKTYLYHIDTVHAPTTSSKSTPRSETRDDRNSAC